MHDSAVRKGVTNAQFNERAFGPVALEISAIAAASGWHYQSWVVFGVILVGLLSALIIKPFARLLAYSLSLVWGAVGYGIGTLVGGLGAQISIGVLFFLIALGMHLAATKYAQDIGGQDE